MPRSGRGLLGNGLREATKFPAVSAEVGTEAAAPSRARPGRRISEIGGRGRAAGLEPAVLLTAAAFLLSAGLLLHWLSWLTFWRDEWDFLLHRRTWSAGTFFDPFVEHLVAIPVLIYKVLVTTLGMDSAAPYQLVAVILFLLSVALLWIYVRRRMGAWLALASVLPILFLGPSWDDLLFPFQMALFGSMAFGLGSLLALDRRDRTGDLVAMACLIVSLLFSDLGIPFVACATVELGLTRDRFRRAFVVAIPTALWALWYLGWGHNATTFISFHNFANLPSYVSDGLASTVSTLLGLGAPRNEASVTSLDWGRPLLVLVVLLAGWRLYRLGRASDRLLAVLALLLVFWSLTGLNTSPLGPPTAGRYQYIGVVMIVLVAVELARGIRVGRPAMAILLLVSAAAALSNLSQLRDTANGLAGIAKQERGGLAALELTRGEVDPGFELTQQNSGVDYLGLLDAGSYFSAVDAYGSPAYSPAELAGAPEIARVAADKVFAAALGARLASAAAARTTHCELVQPSATPAVVELPPAGLTLRAKGGSTRVSLRRYATESFPVARGALSPGGEALVQVPGDRSTQPWQLALSGPGPVSVCDVSA